MPYNAYTGQQGQGLATTFGRSRSVDAYARLQQAKGQQKEKEKSAAKAKMQEYAPEETWHFYSAELQNRYDDLVSQGSELMANRGITNPWNSNDPDAVDWQIQMSKLKASSANVQQYQEEYNKAMQAIATRGDEYTERYKESIRNFPVANDLDAVLQGDVPMPQPEFKNPSKIFTNFLVKTESRLRDKIDGYISDKDVATETAQYFASPENKDDLQAAQQMYNELSPAQKDEMEALAEQQGFESPVVAYQFKNLRNRINPPSINLYDEAVNIASSIPLVKRGSAIEDTEGVTTTSRTTGFADAEAHKKAARSYVASNAWMLNDEAAMSQLDVPMNIPVNKRRILAEQNFAKIIKDNEPKEVYYGKDRAGAGGLGQEEIDAAFDLWREDLGSNNLEVANEAAGYLFATGNLQGFGDVVNAQVTRPIIPEGFVSPVKDAINQNGMLTVRFGSGTAMQRAKERYFKELQEQLDSETEAVDPYSGTTQATPQELKEANEQLLKTYKEASEGNTLYIPIMPASEQILKRLHDQAAKEMKTLYQRVGDKYTGQGVQNDWLGVGGSNEVQEDAPASDPLNLYE